MNLAYYKIVPDKYMVETVNKTWRERITWKFWIKTKTVPMTSIVIVEKDNLIICHPTMLPTIEEQIEKLI